MKECVCLLPLKGASCCFVCYLVVSGAEETLLKRINLAGTPETLEGKQLVSFFVNMAIKVWEIKEKKANAVLAPTVD